MAVSKCSFLVCLFVFLCLSLSSANRVLKDNKDNVVENESLGQDVPSGQDDQPNGFGHARMKGNIPKFSAVGTTNGCGNYGGNCGQNCGYACPPSYGCGGGNSGCQSWYSCPPCQWQGCQGTPPSYGCMSSGDPEVQLAELDKPAVEAMAPTNT